MRDKKNGLMMALVVLLCLALATGTYFVLYAPTLEARSRALKQAAAVETQNASTRNELDVLAQLQEELPQMEADLAASRSKFPTSGELSEFTSYLAELARSSVTRVTNVTASRAVALTLAQPLPAGPGGYTPPVVPPPPPGLYQYHFQITLTGTVEQTQAFLRSLQADSARMFLVNAVEVQGSELTPGATTNQAEYVVTGYTYALVPVDQIPTQVEGGQ
ncbi:MAG: hypothetical protein LBO75_02145 [Bifidobacteriaceae bacterium]|jgi:hypothetical protein|nr:hypothetical protein [Bifidobacteriaceae bacterium]